MSIDLPLTETAIGLAQIAIEKAVDGAIVVAGRRYILDNTECASEPIAQSDGVVVIAARRYLTPERLAKTLKKSTRTLARWNEQGVGPPRIKVGKQPF